jgi:hypothetical protein
MQGQSLKDSEIEIAMYADPSSKTMLSRKDIEETIAAHFCMRVFAEHLRAADDAGLLRILSRFIYYASIFGACQAQLAGELAARQGLFRDPSLPGAFDDCSVEVACGVFFGAIDEFGDREVSGHITHRVLGQATLKALCQYFSADDATLRKVMKGHEPTRESIRRTMEGYGVNMALDDAKLFRCLGFHLATELLADEEFCTIASVLRSHHKPLVDFLQDADVTIAGRKVPALYWIDRHTVADAEHFAAAVESGNQALSFYAGPDRALAKTWMLQGVAEMAKLEAYFMGHVAEPAS